MMPKKIRFQNWKLCLRFGVSGILLGWFVLAFDWREIVGSIREVSLRWIVLALFWIMAAMLISTIKWRAILKAQGFVFGYKQLWQIYWIGLFFNNFLPSSIGGDAWRVLRIGKISGDHAGAAASVVIERMLAAAGLAVVGLLAGFFRSEYWWGLTALFGVLFLLVLGLLGLLMWGKVPDRVVRRDNRLARFWRGIVQHGRLIRTQPLAFVKALFWSILFQICVVGVNYALFRGLDLSLSWVEALYIVPAISVLSMIPVGINGHGIREGAYVVLLGAYGVTQVAAFTASILFAFLVSLSSLYGGLLWLREKQTGVTEQSKMEV